MRQKNLCCLALVLSAVLVALPASAQGVDPFYVNLLREGKEALARGQGAAAARSLRIACFGLLDDPKLLTDGLVHLALSQANLNDEAAFAESVRRVLEVDGRFSTYAAAVAPQVRQAFEEQLVARTPAALLADSPTFAPIVQRQAGAALAKLPLRERRRELERRLAAAPGDAGTRLQLAELELADSRESAALATLEPLLAAEPDNVAAICLRGRAAADLGRCPEATADLARCPSAASDGALAERRLRCLLDQRSWESAAQALEQLTPAVRTLPAIATLARRIGEGRAASAKAAPAPSSTPAPAESPPKALVSKPAAPALSPGEEQQLTRARTLLSSARARSDLAEAYRLATGVADAHPGRADAQILAGEIAYRSSRWSDAVRYFNRAGELSDEQPVLLFYLAVSLYESGDRPAAAAVLRRALPKLQRTPNVDLYVSRILPETG